jgi:hypothetical protein
LKTIFCRIEEGTPQGSLARFGQLKDAAEIS